MKNSGNISKTKRMTLAAVMTALIFVFTWLIKFPIPGTGGAYLNFGDIIIYISAYILGGPITALAAGIGSFLADFAVGSAVYALPTLIIKALMGLACGLLAAKSRGAGFYILSCAVGGAIMAGGYFLFEFFFFDAAYAAAALPFNILQWAAGASVAIMFYKVANNISTYYSLRYGKEDEASNK